jgi:hypothetical protein
VCERTDLGLSARYGAFIAHTQASLGRSPAPREPEGNDMSNPWLKKNPFMSMWLSTANRVAGSMRGQATAEAKRQVKAAVTEATNENIRLWSAAAQAPAAKKKKPRQR